MYEDRLRRAQSSLSDDIRKVIDQAYEQSQKQNKPISDGRIEGDLVVADFFDTIIIDSQVSEAITKSINKSFESIHGEISIGLLLREAKTPHKAKKWILKTEEYLRSRLVNTDCFKFISEQYPVIDYLKELYHCLELITMLIKKSKRIQRVKSGYFLEYCALCWRLVNKNKLLEFDESADYSASYCLEHHPKKFDWKYQCARSALRAAIEKSDHELNELKEELIRKNNDGSLTPRFLYKATARFAKKPSRIDLDKYHTGDFWRNRASRIIEISKPYYPHASEAMKSILIDELSSWQEWFYAVINSLDPSKTDESNWVCTNIDWSSMSDDKAAISLDVGEVVLLNIIHRYECVSNINATPRPRGPEKGAVKKNEALRSDIIFLANKQKTKNNEINGAQIAKELDISRQRVSVLLKELGLR